MIGLVHWFLRHRFLMISFQPASAVAFGWNIRWWDFWFYLSFRLVITFSVPIAGVLLVFSFVVVPAAIAFQFTRRYDLPTGPIVVCMFGLFLILASLTRIILHRGGDDGGGGGREMSQASAA